MLFPFPSFTDFPTHIRICQGAFNQKSCWGSSPYQRFWNQNFEHSTTWTSSQHGLTVFKWGPCWPAPPLNCTKTIFNIEWQFSHVSSLCTTQKLNGNNIWTVEWWLALILAPSGGVGANYSGLGQSESSITSEELWGLGQWECSINAIKWARLLQQQWNSYSEWTETILQLRTISSARQYSMRG